MERKGFNQLGGVFRIHLRQNIRRLFRLLFVYGVEKHHLFPGHHMAHQRRDIGCVKLFDKVPEPGQRSHVDEFPCGGYDDS
jgi:hypothetical protein